MERYLMFERERESWWSSGSAVPTLLAACELDLKAFDMIVTVVQQIRDGTTDPKNALDIIYELASTPAAPFAIARAGHEERKAENEG
jgi:hypothetical protein